MNTFRRNTVVSAIVALVSATVALTCGGTALAIEEPDYDVILQSDHYEVRRYNAYLIAEVDVEGDLQASGSAAFQILAGYIFGANQGARKMAMTAPVETRPAGSGSRMAMTAPVTASIADGGAVTYAFVMEKQYTLDTLPTPNDPRIRLRTVAPRVVAAHRYSGRWTPANYREHEAKLLAALAEDGVATRGAPLLARYNGPMTPWFMRRNEVLIEIDWSEGD